MYRETDGYNILIFQHASRKVGEVIAPRDAWLPIPGPGQSIHLAEPNTPPTAWEVLVVENHAYLGGNIIVTITVAPIPYEPIIHLV